MNSDEKYASVYMSKMESSRIINTKISNTSHCEQLKAISNVHFTFMSIQMWNWRYQYVC